MSVLALPALLLVIVGLMSWGGPEAPFPSVSGVFAALCCLAAVAICALGIVTA